MTLAMTDPQAAPGGDEPLPVPYLRPGQTINLVRWTFTGDEWRYSTLCAEYVRRDEHNWYLVHLGEHKALARSQWAIFN